MTAGITCSKSIMETQEQRENLFKLTMKTPERRDWRRSGVRTVKYFIHCSGVSIFDFQQVDVSWG